MTQSARKPRLFIASAAESLAVSYSVQENLDYDAECTVWTQGVFGPTRQALQDLLEKLGATDFAVFVFTADDIVKIRGTEHAAVRDNVVFELGLSMGHLGPEHCFMVAPLSARNLHLPSDLLGLTPLTFNDGRSDGNLVAALGSACNQIRRAMQSVTVRAAAVVELQPVESGREKMERLITLWESPPLEEDREFLRKGVPFSVVEDEDGRATAAIERVFAFLNSVAQTVFSSPDTEKRAREVFGKAVGSVWSLAFTYFPPPSAPADEAWGDELPPLALLAQRWKTDP